MGNYISSNIEETKQMLQATGCKEIKELYENVPESVYLNNGLNLPSGLSEMEAIKHIISLANKNKVYDSIFRGAGAYDHYIPAIVKSVTSKEEFLTAYTPYQSEISQGLLQSIFEYQTMICELTGMDVSNASVYDGATAAAEAVTMCCDKKRKKFIVSSTANPQTIETIKTYSFGSGIEIILVDEKDGCTDYNKLLSMIDDQVAGVYIEQPNFFGVIEDCDKVEKIVHGVKSKFVLGVNPILLGVSKTPAELGADIAVGEGQPLGMPLSFGGPYIGFMATTKALTRKLPGRIVGQTLDSDGKTAYVMTLQAREQHIRREKALSNICSNEALCALTVSVYLSTMGAKGLKKVAINSMSKAHYLANELVKIGFSLDNDKEFFNEFVTICPISQNIILSSLDEENILGGLPLKNNRILWCCTEKNTKEAMDKVINIIKRVI